MSTVIVVTCIR